jgi:hypothetical protein
MKISEAFSGAYLKASDLPQPRVLIVQSIVVEVIGEDKSSKPVLRFIGEQRGLVLNKVNGLEISSWYGDETANWIGQPVELYSSTTFFSGRQVPCIRVRRPAVQYQQPVQHAPQQLQQPVQQAPQMLVQPVQQQPQLQQPQQQPSQTVNIPSVPYDA